MNPLLALLFSTLTLWSLLVISQSMWDSAMWTWVSGNSTANVFGVYGTKGVPSMNNYPGSRFRHSMVFHSSLNCLFVFAGHGYVTSNIGLYPVISLEAMNHSNVSQEP